MSDRHLNVVAGESVPSAEGGWADVLSPVTEEVIAQVPASDAADVDRAVASARAAFPDWSALSPRERSQALLRLANALEEDAEDFARTESRDVGKPLSGARHEVAEAVDALRFFAGAARLLEGTAAGEYLDGHTSFIRREPLGVIGQIAPWNFPLTMAVWKVAPALAAGNTCVLKPSELTPLTALMLGERSRQVLPAGALNVVAGEGQGAGQRLVEHPDVQMVSLTGATETGRAVATAAAKSLKRVHLELGGKTPILIFADGDLDQAVEAICLGAFYNAGQDCTAASRLLVDDACHDDLLERLVPAVEALRLGRDPSDEDFDVGPVISSRQRDRVLGFVDRSERAGARIVRGGGAPNGRGYFVEPTIVTGPTQDSEIIQNEVFGPVVTVQRFDSESRAFAAANDVPYGLAAAVFTNDASRAMRASRALQFGTVWVNCHYQIAHEMPHGGFKASGYGKDISKYALEEYTETKHVMIRAAASEE